MEDKFALFVKTLKKSFDCDQDNGTVYDGEWKDDKEHGHGVMKYSDGHVYEGDWENGVRKIIGQV